MESVLYQIAIPKHEASQSVGYIPRGVADIPRVMPLEKTDFFLPAFSFSGPFTDWAIFPTPKYFCCYLFLL